MYYGCCCAFGASVRTTWKTFPVTITAGMAQNTVLRNLI